MSDGRSLPGCTVLPPMENGRVRRDQPTTDPPDKTEPKEKANRRKAGDRFRILNAFADFTLAGLNRNEIAVWLLLWRDTRDGTARTSQADLARRAGVSDRTIRTTLRSLSSKQLLRVVRRGGIGRGASAYRIRSVPPEE
jgi:predicted DNA-binding transcriptional regulator